MSKTTLICSHPRFSASPTISWT